MERHSGADLYGYLQKRDFNITETRARQLSYQLATAISYMHSFGVIHRDLKPENILLNKIYDVKIVDFGFACPLEGRDGSGTNKSVIGTPGYMAPEILKKQPYQGQVVDLFALSSAHCCPLAFVVARLGVVVVVLGSLVGSLEAALCLTFCKDGLNTNR